MRWSEVSRGDSVGRNIKCKQCVHSVACTVSAYMQFGYDVAKRGEFKYTKKLMDETRLKH